MAAVSGLLAAGLGAAGAIGSAAMGSSAASSAAQAQLQGQREATQFQREALQQSRIDSMPWMAAGQTALYGLMDGLGLSRPTNPIFFDPSAGPIGSQFAGNGGNAPDGNVGQGTGGQTSNGLASWGSGPMTAAKGFQQTPGYQFQVQQANDAVQNRMAALGLAGSGDAMKGIAATTQGLANAEYGNYLNRLAAMAGMGQTATNSQNALGANAANQMSGIAQAGGNARASSIMGGTNAWSGALGYLTNPNGPVMNGLQSWGSGWGQSAPQFSGFGGENGYTSGLMSGLS